MEREALLALRIVVICGGWSDESDISRRSAAECRSALVRAGFTHVDLIDLADEDFLDKLSHGSYDVAFVAMHGRFGEDGCVQGLLEIMHIPYTFSGVAASAAGTQKNLAKAIYAASGIRAPRGVDFASGHTLTNEERSHLVDTLGLPLFVKPADNGSSYGITRVTDAAQLDLALEVAGRGGSRVLVEECVLGTEVTVPVIGNNDAFALPIVEIVTGADFYDLKVKYEPSELHHVIPARLDPKVYTLVQDIAVCAHKALGCRGCSRSDFIVTAQGEPIILETNTIPGMTESSLLPDSARHAGINFPDLCRMFIEYALEAQDKKR